MNWQLELALVSCALLGLGMGSTTTTWPPSLTLQPCRRSWKQGMRLGMTYALGHALTVVVLGAAVIMLHIRLPEKLDPGRRADRSNAYRSGDRRSGEPDEAQPLPLAGAEPTGGPDLRNQLGVVDGSRCWCGRRRLLLPHSHGTTTAVQFSGSA